MVYAPLLYVLDGLHVAVTSIRVADFGVAVIEAATIVVMGTVENSVHSFCCVVDRHTGCCIVAISLKNQYQRIL